MTRLYKPDYLEQAIFEVLDAVTIDPLVYANQQHHELTPPYVSLSVDTRVPQGRDGLFVTLNDGTRVYHGQRHGTITLLVVGDLCNERAEDIVNALKRADASALFRKHGPVLHSVNTISLRPLMLDGSQQVEQVTVLDIQYRVTVVHYEVGDLIEYVDVRYKVLNAGNQQIARDAFVASLGGAQFEPGRIYDVVVYPPQPELLKVGAEFDFPFPFRFIPNAMPLRADARFSDDSFAEVTTSADHNTSRVKLLKPGSVDYTFEVVNHDGTHISDTVTLQITA